MHNQSSAGSTINMLGFDLRQGQVAAAGYALAIVQSNVPIYYKDIRRVPLVVRGSSIGIWAAIAWHPRRFLPPYAECSSKNSQSLLPVPIRAAMSSGVPRLCHDQGSAAINSVKLSWEPKAARQSFHEPDGWVF